MVRNQLTTTNILLAAIAVFNFYLVAHTYWGWH